MGYSQNLKYLFNNSWDTVKILNICATIHGIQSKFKIFQCFFQYNHTEIKRFFTKKYFFLKRNNFKS